MTISQLFLTAEGRIDRRQYWIGAGIVLALSAGGLLQTIFGAPLGAIGRIVVTQLIGAAGLIMLYPSICFASKRLHDLGLSGWWQLVYYAVGTAIGLPLMIQMMSVVGHLPHGDPEAIRRAAQDTVARAGVWRGISFVLSYGAIIGLGLVPGQPGVNRFDPPQGGGPQAA